jgi:hypothetical protein
MPEHESHNSDTAKDSLVGQFTYDEYRNILIEVAKSGKTMFLRHDVDISLKKALEMAEKEKEFGISSVYFILLTSEYYNALSPENIERIRMIRDLGHTIGLHYDISINPTVTEELHKVIINLQRSTLECQIQQEIEHITFHKPAFGIGPNYELIVLCESIGLRCPDFDRNFKYCSDSGSNWRDYPLDCLKQEKNLHINTHPEWWGKESISWEERLVFLNLDVESDRLIQKEIKNIYEYHTKLNHDE